MSADLELRLHDVGQPVAPVEWAEFHRRDADNPLWSWALLRSVEQAYGDPVVAGTLHDGEDVVGAVVGRVRGIGARRRHPLFTVVELSCAGSSSQPGIRLLTGTPGVAMTPDDLARYAAAVEAVETGLRRDWPGRLDLIWHRQTFAELLPAVQRGLSFVYPGLPSAMLRHGFDSWEAYLATLGRSRRSSVRRVTRQFAADPALQIATRTGIADLPLDTALGLIRSTAERHTSGPRFPPVVYWPHEVLRVLFDQPGVTTLRYRTADSLVAFGALFEDPRVPTHGQWGALERGQGAPSGLWVDQMARTLRHNIEGGATGIIGGKGLTDLKAEFGFEVVPQWTVVRRLAGAT